MNDWRGCDHKAVRVQFLRTGAVFYMDMGFYGPPLGNKYNISGPKDVPRSWSDWQPDAAREAGVPRTLTP